MRTRKHAANGEAQCHQQTGSGEMHGDLWTELKLVQSVDRCKILSKRKQNSVLKGRIVYKRGW